MRPRKRLGPREVRAYWTEQARTHGVRPSASWSDTEAIHLEIREFLKHLADGDMVLDVGCANGYATLHYARERNIRIKGVDYIPEMVSAAKELLAGEVAAVRARVDFAVGDITRLEEPPETYDKVVVTRVLINLGTPKAQERALRECAKALRRDGKLLLSEASLQGWENLNRLRGEWGLSPIPMPPFNRYVNEQSLFTEVADVLRLEGFSSFSSAYFVGTRLLKPLLARCAPVPVDVANPDMEWNRLMASLPTFGDYGTQKLFILRRR